MYSTTSELAAPQPRGVRARLRRVARHSLLSTLARFSHNDEGPFLRLLYCHYVFDDQVEKFRAIVEMLQNIGMFVDTKTAVSMIQGASPIDGKYFHLAFDDGFRNVFQNALPVLKELQVPAILFVPTSIVGADWERTRHYCLETTGYRDVIEMISWEECATLQSWGFEVGSHSRTHARFTTLSGAGMLDDELIGSKGDIEDHLGGECLYITWPYGRQTDADATSLEATRRAGYHACFGSFRGSIYPGKAVDPYRIPRHHFECDWPLSHISYFANGNGEGHDDY